ncbi:MAG: ketopantoate reductase family protein [Hyphomicrobiaceae bacterium]|nr:ketopantoate reductase family protein [Hyphomicrobiaceae bacterium]
MTKPTIVILGAGAVGGYFGARLVQHDAAAVTFLVREPRKAVLARDGLVVESPFGNVTLAVTARTAAELAGANPDFILVTAKAYDLDAAIAAIAPVAGPDTAIVPLLNGVAHMERLNEVFGRERVLGGIVSLQVRQRADGAIEHLNDWQFITVGEQVGGLSPRVERLAAALEQARLTVTATPEIMQKLWEKVVFLATLAGMTTLMRAPLGAIAQAPGGSALTLAMLETNAVAAAHSGFQMPAGQMEAWRKLFTDTTSKFTASMLADMNRNGPVEADHIIGFMLERARAAGADATLLSVAYANLKAYEIGRAAGPA